MDVTETSLPGVLLIDPDVYGDDRGYFHETWRAERYPFAGTFVQDNVSRSRRGTVRGLHLQWPKAQGKLVWVSRGEVFDVVVDVRAGSPTFGKWEGLTLSEANHNQLWIPTGFAHGFAVLSDEALFSYKCTEVYAPECELAIRWNDPQIGIMWPFDEPELSAKDAVAPFLAEVPAETLPPFAE